MPFDAIAGQPTAVGTLKRILQSGRVHHAMRFEGPDGIGKEMAAMAVAQALVCTAGDPLGCGSCSACRRAVTFCDATPAVPMHPDIILIERGLYPPEVLGRTRPELQDISVDQIRNLVLERAAYAPHEGRARVFVVRSAHELSISAGNALLKTLEEPGRNTYFILLVARPARLLSTVQSRTLRIRFAPLSDDVLVRILVGQGIDEALAREVAPLAGGSASAALALADQQASEQRGEFVHEALEAIGAGDAAAALQLAEKRARGDKPALRANLEALAARFARTAHQAAEIGDPRARSSALRYQIVLRAIREMERNASPALLMENMLLRLRAQTG